MSSVKGQRQRILPPYTRQVNDFQHRALKTLGISAMVLVAIVCGYLLALFGTYGWFIPAIPVAILAAVALWLAPDLQTDMARPLTKLLSTYILILLIWPNYIAFNLPGLPWISFQRLTVFPLAMVGIYALATSSATRQAVGEVLASHKLLVRILLIWVIWQSMMQIIGGFSSPGRWVHQIFAYYVVFILMAWLCAAPGMAIRVQRVFVLATVITGLITLWEFYLQYTPWANSIPPFLGIDPEVLEKIQNVRFRSGEYRATSIFLTAVAYGEFIGITLPFIVLAMMNAPRPWQKLLATMALVLHFSAALMNNSRTAMVSFVVVLAGFLAMWVWRRYKQGQQSNEMLGTSALMAFPGLMLFVMTVILTVNRVRVRVLGGSEHRASNEGREVQWEMAMPVIARNPIGHGMGTVSQHVPYTNLAGEFTLDSYPINLLVEVGVPGFLLFSSFFIVAAVTGIIVYLRAQTRDEEVAGAAALSIISFLFTRLVLSSETGQFYAYPMAGLILALWYVQRQRVPAVEPKAAQTPLYQLPPRAMAGALGLSGRH